MKLFSALWETLFPYIPKCVVCGTEKDVADYLCPACSESLHALRYGKTEVSGLAACAAYRYDGPAARLVQRYKYGGGRWLCAFMALAMLHAAADAGIGFDAVCHVPLHPKKRRGRGFDQAEWLARRIADMSGMPFFKVVRRVRNTPSQTKLSMPERKENVRDAFAAVEPVSGSVLLVDDVLTTGATAAECAGVLKAAGAQSVTVLTFARADGIDRFTA